MTYEPHVWETGEIITAQKLNHMEDSIGVKYVHFNRTTVDDNDVYSSDDTIEDVLESYNNGKQICAVLSISSGINMFLNLAQESIIDGETMFIFSNTILSQLPEAHKYEIATQVVMIKTGSGGGTDVDGYITSVTYTSNTPTPV